VVVLDIKEYNKVYSNYHLYENAKEKAWILPMDPPTNSELSSRSSCSLA
jgi:hypothetical protein